MEPSADPGSLHPTDGVFLAGNCNRVAHGENTRRYLTDLTLDMRLERLYILTELQQLMLMHLLVKMDSIIGFRLDKWLLSCNSPSIKCFLYRIMVFLPSIYIITHTELKIPTNHGSKYTSCVLDGRSMSGQSITDANNFNILFLEIQKDLILRPNRYHGFHQNKTKYFRLCLYYKVSKRAEADLRKTYERKMKIQ